MPSERVQRQIEAFLDQADTAVAVDDWQLVRRLCQRILTLDPANADALALAAAAERGLSPSSPTLLPQEKGDARAGEAPAPLAQSVGEGFVPYSPGAGAGSAGASPAVAVPTAFANGRYQVKRFLGEGGKKRVYLAHDTLLDRDVAFALIKTEGLDDAGRDRIRREAQAMGRLGAHPHIVSVFDLGEEPYGAVGSRQSAVDPAATGPTAYLPVSGASELPTATAGHGQPYIVTELMGGGDVEGLIEQAPEHRPPLEQSLEIAIQVCRGLEFAHATGIVHRDLKPGNVWLTASLAPGLFPTREGETSVPSPRGGGLGRGQGAGGEGGTAKIGDFGLAVALDRSRLTQAGMMVGTVAYMPPEQAMGGEVTPRSDLYSLGAMLYELVTGRPPFVGDESVAIISQHLNVAPVSPSWHNASVPPALEALILRLLEKDPAKRPQSAAEVRVALEGIASAGAMNRAATPGEGGSSLSPMGEGEDGGSPPLAGEGLGERSDNPMYRRTFVGREPELKQLQGAYDAATSGQGSLVMVVGEPGIGKTSVCEQLATYATVRGGRTLVGHCYEEGSLSLPYLPFVEAMRSYVLAREPDALRKDLGSGAGDIARIVSEIRDRLPDSVGARFIAPASTADPEEERYRLFQAVSSFLRNAAMVQPLAIVLEDLHDADRGSLELLLHLSRSLAGSRLLLVGTYRDIEVDRAHPLSSALAELRRASNFSRVLLRGLTADEVQRMLSSISGQEVRWELAEAVHRQTEGNPLFVQEVLRYLVEEGLIKREGGRWRPSGDTPLVASIPEGLRDVIGKRLQRLSPECNRLLSVASVIGRDFSLATLQAVAGVEQDVLVEVMEEARRVAVLTEQARVGAVQYRFAHAFFRQTLYEELGAARRLRMHQDVARVLEGQYAGRLEEHAAELAEHFTQSTDAADLAKAVRYAELAAQRALAVYAYGEAARHLEQALDVQEVLDPDDKAKRCDLLLALGEALLSAGEPKRVVEALTPEALMLAEAISDTKRASRACQETIEALLRQSGAMGFRTPLYKQWAEAVDRYAAPETADRVRADSAMAAADFFSDMPAEGWNLLQGALTLARRLGDSEALYQAALYVVLLTWRPHDQDERLSIARELFPSAGGGASAATVGRFLFGCFGVFLGWGERQQAEAAMHQMKQIGDRTHDIAVSLQALGAEITLLVVDGDLEQAVQEHERLRERADELGIPGIAGDWTSTSILWALIHLGRPQDALDRMRWISSRWNEVGLTMRPTSALAALCLAQMNRLEEAGERFDRFRPLWAEASATGEEAMTGLLHGLAAAVVLQDRELARQLREGLSGVSSLIHDRYPTVIARHLGDASALLGEREQALAYYEQALEVAGKVRFRPEIALTHLAMAELLQDAGDGAEAGAIHRAPTPQGGSGSVGARHASPSRAPGKTRAGRIPALPDSRAEALAHLDFAISELRDMKMQPALERALRHKEVLKA